MDLDLRTRVARPLARAASRRAALGGALGAAVAGLASNGGRGASDG